jgi:hypothetical protein
VKGSARYARLRSRHERLWRDLAQTEREIVDLIGRAGGLERGADIMQSESHGYSTRIVAYFPATLHDAIERAADAERCAP